MGAERESEEGATIVALLKYIFAAVKDTKEWGELIGEGIDEILFLRQIPGVSGSRETSLVGVDHPQS